MQCDQHKIMHIESNIYMSECKLNDRRINHKCDNDETKPEWCPDPARVSQVDRCGVCHNYDHGVSMCEKLDAFVDKNSIYEDCPLEML